MDPAHTTFHPIYWASQCIRPMLPQVAVAITSTILAIFGSSIHDWFKDLFKKRPFVIRVTVFVLLVAFGYGALNLAVSHLLAQCLMRIGDLWLSPLLLGTFIALGILAEEKRQI